MGNHIQFERRSSEFGDVLNERVSAYFRHLKTGRNANAEMKIKTVVMFLALLIPYTLMLLDVFNSPLLFCLCWLLIAVGVSGIGLGVMHDANHDAYSRQKKVNALLGLTINLLGANQLNWKIQHNVLHHTYTNIEGYDDSLEAGKLLRFSPHQIWRKQHRYQFYYAWFLYSLQTISWILLTDFQRMSRYRRAGLLEKMSKHSYSYLVIEMILFKLLHLFIFLIIPLMIVSVPSWWVLSGFIGMHLCAGFFLACVFQATHVMPVCVYPLPDAAGKMENEWAVHQLVTSCNYATQSRWFSWFLGGLNFQAEHHLFPNICHVHYPAISKILRTTAAEFGLPYQHYRTFFGAIAAHARMLALLSKLE